MIFNSGKIFDSAAADKNHRVFLQVMSLAGNVSSNFLAVS